jgi:hypothetical protein
MEGTLRALIGTGTRKKRAGIEGDLRATSTQQFAVKRNG